MTNAVDRIRFHLSRVLAPKGNEPEAEAVIETLDVKDPLFLIDDPSFREILQNIDAKFSSTPSERRPDLFNEVPLQLFALLALTRPGSFPNISAWLPAMPSETDQVNTTGLSGAPTLLEATNFVDAVVQRYEAGGRSIKAAQVLDYGICWARQSRLFYKYTPVEQLYGVDPWAVSLNLARECGFKGHLALIDEAPLEIPFATKFDVVFAFSIFTHLEEDVSRIAITTIRKSMNPGGLLALTVRPYNFWRLLDEKDQVAAKETLDASGYAFVRDPWTIAEGRTGYGNSIYTLDYIENNWADFKILNFSFSLSEPYQIYVFLEAT